ncbi:hypothetical protein Q5O89_13890 [Peribacillus frigoritolerans]|nr:hypothetical protein [Peribacillus frigoritolerans]
MTIILLLAISFAASFVGTLAGTGDHAHVYLFKKWCHLPSNPGLY